jgi:hypothetical protein
MRKCFVSMGVKWVIFNVTCFFSLVCDESGRGVG